MKFILPIITALACLLSFMLLLRDMEDQQKKEIGESSADMKAMPIPKSVMIYSAICILGTVAIAAWFPGAYPNNTVWVNSKCMLLLAILWPVAYIDFKTLRIPNLFIIYGLIVRGVILVFELFLGNPLIWTSLLSEVIAAGALLLASVLCALCIRNGIGFGDMKLFIVMGLMLGMEGIWGAMFLALLASFCIAIFLLITKKKTRKDAIPFGPAIVLGTYLSICLSGM